jgi:TolB protein
MRKAIAATADLGGAGTSLLAPLWALLVATVLAACVLLVGRGEPAKAAFPGENGRLVFGSFASSGPGVNNPTGDDEIFTIRPDGTGLVQLTHNKVYDYDPAWSPNGNKIAFSRSGGDATEVYVMRADGTQKIQITDSPGGNWDNWDPTWSPNGARIAFQSNRDVTNNNLNTNIYSVRSDGTGERQLTKNTASDLMPDWSPDGTKIAFYTTRYSTNANDSSSDIALMNADGSNPRRLTSTPGFDYDPEWSPNGAWIAFESSGSLYKIRVDGTGLKNLTATQVTSEYSTDPAWSPDGRKIAFRGTRVVRFDPDLGEYIYEYGIYLIDPDGSGESKIPGSEGLRGKDLDWQRLPAQ